MLVARGFVHKTSKNTSHLISFRSLLEGSDTISIDTAVVSSQEFDCLLDMVYTGKLPLGKHNISRIVAAADSLQMFDVAVSFKHILTRLVNQEPLAPANSVQTSNLPVSNKTQSGSPEGSDLPCSNVLTSDKVEMTAEVKKREHCQSDRDDTVEPTRKQPCVDTSGPFQWVTMLKACFVYEELTA